MSSFKGWKDKRLQVTSLMLDAENPRIPEMGKNPSQRDIAAELIRHDGAYDLARDIAEQGYFPSETLIATKENGQMVVLEGNRRLAALKCLLSPSFAPEEYEKRFRLLQAKRDTAALRKVRVSVAPSREVAVPIILARHTQQGIQRWEPQQQAKFVASLVSLDMTVDEVAKQYGIAPGDVLRAIKVHTMYQVACVLDLPDDIIELVRNPRAFSVSTLERLIDTASFRDFVGIEFDDSGALQGKTSAEEFKKGYSRIVSDIATGKVSSRELNTTKQIEKYLSGFNADAPDVDKKGSFTALSLLPKGVVPKAKPRPQKSPRKSKQSPSIIPRGFTCSLSSPRINDIFRELKSTRVDTHENSVGVMLRIFVELTVSHHLEKTRKIQPLLEKAKKKGKPPDWTPTLRQMLNLLLDDSDVQKEISRSALKALKRAVQNDNHPMSLDSLDQFVHNRLVAPTVRDLRSFWAQFEELLKFLMAEPI